MCDIDGATWATWAAVVAALAIALTDHFRQRRKDAAAARVIAALMRPDIELLGAQLRGLEKELTPEEGGVDMTAVLIIQYASSRQDIVNRADALAPEAFESLIPRLHVLDAAALDAMTSLLASIKVIQITANALNAASQQHLDEMGIGLVGELRERVSVGVNDATIALKEFRRIAP